MAADAIDTARLDKVATPPVTAPPSGAPTAEDRGDIRAAKGQVTGTEVGAEARKIAGPNGADQYFAPGSADDPAVKKQKADLDAKLSDASKYDQNVVRLTDDIAHAKSEDEARLRKGIIEAFGNKGDVFGASYLHSMLSDVLENPTMSEKMRQDIRQDLSRFTPNGQADSMGALRAAIAGMVLTGRGFRPGESGPSSGVPSGNARQLNGAKWEQWLRDEQGMSASFRVGGREIDGALPGKRWVEAKSGRYWQDMAAPGPGYDKFRSDIGSRQKLAQDSGATLEVHSNSPIPDYIKSWLSGRGIPYVEY